jgi:hypothetical protein
VGAGEVARESSQLITTVPDEGDGLHFVSNFHKVITSLVVVLTFKLLL